MTRPSASFVNGGSASRIADRLMAAVACRVPAFDKLAPAKYKSAYVSMVQVVAEPEAAQAQGRLRCAWLAKHKVDRDIIWQAQPAAERHPAETA